MATNAIDVFRLSLAASRSPVSPRGPAYTSKEVESAIRPLIFLGNNTVDRDDYYAAKKVLESDSFKRSASPDAKIIARDFISGFKGRWSPSSFPEPVAPAPKYQPGKLYSIPRSPNMPSPPAGYAWGMLGLDPSNGNNVLAKLAPAPRD